MRLASVITGTCLLLSFAMPAHSGLNDLLKSAGDLVGGGSTSAQTASLSDSQISSGLRDALAVGARRAVELLGKQGGFLNDASVKIPLPGVLETAGKGLRAAGQGKYVDAFETSMNRAAEEAIPETLSIVEDTVRKMSLQDARGILSGGDDAATRYLEDKAGDQLRAAVLPIVSRATDSAGVTAAYKSMKKEAEGMMGGFGALGGLVDSKSLDLDDYVADKALDGLFVKLAAEEKMIRENPAARTTDILKTVFAK